MPRGDDDEREWLRFFLRRLRAALRYAKSPETTEILKELIAEIEARLDEPKNLSGCLTRATARIGEPPF